MAFELLLNKVIQTAHIVLRPLTMGVRGAVFDPHGRIFLVRHTYVPGWYMPGGGVDPGETVVEALKREMIEEAHIELLEEPVLVSVHFNRKKAKRDHVLFFRCRAHRQTAPKRPDAEIAETGWFPADALPKGTTDATRRRLDELAGKVPPDPEW